MKRREFSLQLAAAGAASLLTPSVRAQLAPVEGKDFIKLQTPVPANLPSPQKKVEVIEFFSYSCPHCFAFEPSLEAWVKQLPPDVHYHPMPYAFFGAPAQQKMFYALEEMGQRQALHRKIFNAIHVQKKLLNTEDEITAYLATEGVDSAKFADALNSFGVNTKMSRGKQIANAYKIDGVPALAVHGRYYTSPSIARSQERALAVADGLIQQVRQGG
jgi:protein dithiol oxidoreductase (disulfide-forming)